jgi:hypothetical protein
MGWEKNGCDRTQKIPILQILACHNNLNKYHLFFLFLAEYVKLYL